MKRVLRRMKQEFYYLAGGERIEGFPAGIRGDLSGITGNLSDAEITDEERIKGVNIVDLIVSDE